MCAMIRGGRFERDAMFEVDTVHWHCPSLSRVQPFLGCPGITGNAPIGSYATVIDNTSGDAILIPGQPTP